ncbi:MAG: septum site-determining protein Ssd, partial [Stackebrandtia sp.]
GSDLLAVVVPGEVRAVAAARQAIAGFAGQCDRVRLVVRGPSPGRLSTTDIAEAVGVPLAGELRTDSRIAGATEVGGLPARARHGILSATADALLADLRSTANPALSGANQ